MQPIVLHMFVVAGSWHGWVGTQPWQLLATTNICKTRGCNYSYELLMMRGVSHETCWAIKKHWNNKFYYTVASCWLFLYDLYYDAGIHEHQIPWSCQLTYRVGPSASSTTFLAGQKLTNDLYTIRCVKGYE